MRPSFVYFLVIVSIGFIFVFSADDFAPIRELRLIQFSGQFSLAFLICTLLVSPVMRLVGKKSEKRKIVRLRRTFGLATTLLGCFHLLLVFQFEFVTNFSTLISEPQWRNGFTALSILLILAMTSFAGVNKRLGIRLWKPLHRLAYAALFFALLHTLVSPDLQYIELSIFGIAIGIFFVIRFLEYFASRTRKKLQTQD